MAVTSSSWVAPLDNPDIEVTCAEINALNAQADAIPGQAYIVTDYNRGTVGAAIILVHGVTDGSIGHTADISTEFDNSAWHGRFDPDTCRIYDMRDNRGNYIRGDVGVEIENFPWGNARVSGNDFHSVNFDYGDSGARVEDNYGGPTVFLQVRDANTDVRNNHFHSQADIRLNGDYRMFRSTVGSNARVYANNGEGGEMDYCTVSNNAYLELGPVILERNTFEAGADVRTRGAVGRIDRSNFGRCQVILTNCQNVDIDDLTIHSFGRILMINSARCRILRSTISQYSYIQRVNGAPEIVLEYSTIKNLSLVRAWNNAVITVNRTDVGNGGRVDCLNGNNQVRHSTIKEDYVRFWDTATNCLFDYNHISGNGSAEFRGTSDGARIHRTNINAGRVQIWNSNARIFYCTVNSARSYIISRDSSALITDVTCDSWGRMDIQQGRTGTIQGLSISGTAYVRLRGGTGVIQHSSFDGFYYHYCDNQVGLHQGLHAHGRQTFTAPTTAITGAAQRNF
jgi:hypothetical protein